MRYYYSFFGGCSDSWRRSRVKSDSFSIEFKDENTWNSLFSLQINDVHTLLSFFIPQCFFNRFFKEEKLWNYKNNIWFELNWMNCQLIWIDWGDFKIFSKDGPSWLKADCARSTTVQILMLSAHASHSFCTQLWVRIQLRFIGFINLKQENRTVISWVGMAERFKAPDLIVTPRAPVPVVNLL